MYKPRSIRNNNPFSLEDNGIDWDGLDTPRNDGIWDSHGNKPQLRFKTPEDGIRAGVDNLIHLVEGFKGRAPLATPQELFRVYAPATNGNDPEQYAQLVADKLGIGTQEPFDLRQQLHDLADAIVLEETGKPLTTWYQDRIVYAGIQAGQDAAGYA